MIRPTGAVGAAHPLNHPASKTTCWCATARGRTAASPARTPDRRGEDAARAKRSAIQPLIRMRPRLGIAPRHQLGASGVTCSACAMAGAEPEDGGVERLHEEGHGTVGRGSSRLVDLGRWARVIASATCQTRLARREPSSGTHSATAVRSRPHIAPRGQAPAREFALGGIEPSDGACHTLRPPLPAIDTGDFRRRLAPALIIARSAKLGGGFG